MIGVLTKIIYYNDFIKTINNNYESRNNDNNKTNDGSFIEYEGEIAEVEDDIANENDIIKMFSMISSFLTPEGKIGNVIEETTKIINTLKKFEYFRDIVDKNPTLAMERFLVNFLCIAKYKDIKKHTIEMKNLNEISFDCYRKLRNFCAVYKGLEHIEKRKFCIENPGFDKYFVVLCFKNGEPDSVSVENIMKSGIRYKSNGSAYYILGNEINEGCPIELNNNKKNMFDALVEQVKDIYDGKVVLTKAMINGIKNDGAMQHLRSVERYKEVGEDPDNVIKEQQKKEKTKREALEEEYSSFIGYIKEQINKNIKEHNKKEDKKNISIKTTQTTEISTDKYNIAIKSENKKIFDIQVYKRFGDKKERCFNKKEKSSLFEFFEANILNNEAEIACDLIDLAIDSLGH